MPQERENQYPITTAEEWEKAKQGVPREVAAARLIVSREITGRIPHRPYLLGDSDQSPVMRSVAQFAARVYALLDAMMVDSDDLSNTLIDAGAEVYSAMEDFKL